MERFEVFLNHINLPNSKFAPTDTQLEIFNMLDFGNLTNSVWGRREGVTTAILIRMMYETIALNRRCIYVTSHGSGDKIRAFRDFGMYVLNSFAVDDPYRVSLSGSSLHATSYNSKHTTRLVSFKDSIDGLRGLKYDTVFLDLEHTELNIKRWSSGIDYIQRPHVTASLDFHAAYPASTNHVHVLWHHDPR